MIDVLLGLDHEEQQEWLALSPEERAAIESDNDMRDQQAMLAYEEEMRAYAEEQAKQDAESDSNDLHC